jgi:hypothetical protein
MRGLSETFAVNAVNGTASLSVPLPMSPGRAGFTLQLNLTYDSGAGYGPFGMGWNLSIAAISRRTDRGLPLYRHEVESDIFVLAGAEGLVPDLDLTGARVRLHRTVNGHEYDIFSYRPRIEGLYARIERWTRSDTSKCHWRTITNDNVTSRYGFDDGSMVASDHDPKKAFA